MIKINHLVDKIERSIQTKVLAEIVMGIFGRNRKMQVVQNI